MDVTYDDLVAKLREYTKQLTREHCSLELVVRLTRTRGKFMRALAHEETIALPEAEKAEDLNKRHKRKKMIVAPVEAIEQARQWEDFAEQVPNLIPYYQYVYNFCVPSQRYTTWFFIKRYLHIACKLPYEQIAQLSDDVFRRWCPLRQRGAMTLDETLHRLETCIRHCERLRSMPYNIYQIKRYNEALQMYKLLTSDEGFPECPICYDDINDIAVTSCHHSFCVTCLDTWMDVNENMPSCPMCRTSLEGSDTYMYLMDGKCVEHGTNICSAARLIQAHFISLSKNMFRYFRRDVH